MRPKRVSTPGLERKPGVLAFLAIALLLTTPALGQIYKWVDDQGVTHYGARPPQGQNARPLGTAPAAGPAKTTPKPESSTDWQNQDIEFQKRRIQREREAEREQKEAKEKERRCIIARDDLRQLQTVERLYDLNDKGERIYLDDATRKAEIERTQEIISRNCI
jgi:hypothetical protein